jgi:serine/threonine protein kinase/tetratricopeptide (TPR) repeat protein
LEERTSPSAPETGVGGASLELSPYLDQVLEVPVAQRDAWLQELESREPRIAADLRRLLAAQFTVGFASFLNEPVAPTPTAYALTGELIGSFRILRELGQGGMAVVYLAERADGHYSQRVALKILRVGLEGSQAQFHFAQERQILASLEHQSIARLIDGGITATGLPYLAMEYVEGVPIDRYCDEQRLPLDARLKLFLKVADAVQYAHRHLIVHRDLKPSNIIVTSEGAVKLLDFGIAKLLAPGTFEHVAPPTRDGVWLMTPEYASPEQVLGKAVTTATDIYQLGLLLYGLLTGREPYAVRGRTPLEAFRVICESEPIPPSSAIVSAQADNETQTKSAAHTSATRATSPDRLRRSLRDDLDAILLKALRKEPVQRYASVEWFMDDIRRHQHGLTVRAYDGVWVYRAAKFLHRHATILVVAGIAIVAVAFITTWYTVQLARERNRARLEAASATQVAEFLASVFRGSNSRVANGGTTARELLDRGAARIETELAGQPEIKARLLNVIGDVYVQYDLPEEAQPLLERALLQNTQLFGRNSKEAADSLDALAKLARGRDDLQRARSLYEEVLQIRERVLGPRHVAVANTLSALAAAFTRLGDSPAAIRASERAIDIYTDSVDPGDERILSAANILATAAIDAGDLRRARAQFEQLLPMVEHSLGPSHRNFAAVLGNLAYLRIELGDYQGVEPELRRSIEIYERLYGPDHSSITIRRVALGLLFYNTGRVSESIAAFQHAIDSQRRVSGPGDRIEAHALLGMALTLRSRGDLEEALERLQSTLDIHRKAIGSSHDDYAEALQAYGEIQLEAGNLAAAGPALSEALAIFRGSRVANHYETAGARIANALALVRTGMPEPAETEIREAISVYQRVFPPEHRLLAAAHSALGESLLAQGKIAEAEQLLVSSARQLGGSLHYERRLALRRLIQLHERKGSLASARQFMDELAAFEQQVRSQ